VEDCPAQLQHIIDDFTYELSLLYHRFKLWLGHRLSLFLHLQSTVCKRPCLSSLLADRI